MSSGVQVGSRTVAGLPSVSANWMAVMGLQKTYQYLESQQAMAASAIAMLSSANRRAFCERFVSFSTTIVRAIRFQNSGVLPFQNLATSVWKSVRVEPVRLPSDLTSWKSAAY